MENNKPIGGLKNYSIPKIRILPKRFKMAVDRSASSFQVAVEKIGCVIYKSPRGVLNVKSNHVLTSELRYKAVFCLVTMEACDARGEREIPSMEVILADLARVGLVGADAWELVALLPHLVSWRYEQPITALGTRTSCLSDDGSFRYFSYPSLRYSPSEGGWVYDLAGLKDFKWVLQDSLYLVRC